MECRKYLLISIKPQYAKEIIAAQKTVELRKSRPKIKNGDILVIYESSPVMKVTGICEVEKIIEMPINSLWEIVNGQASVSREEFFKYYEKKINGIGIFLKNPRNLAKKIKLKEISNDIIAPQSYRYITEEMYKKVLCLGFEL